MITRLTDEQKADFLKRGFTRRAFSKISSVLAAGATLPFYNEAALAQLSMIGPLPPDAVKINANENPLGPCPEAAQAIYNVIQKGGRYWYEETFNFARTLAEQEGVKPDYVLPFAGSSDPLHRAVLAFTSPSKSLVMADPGYEAGSRAADFIGSKVHKIPLRKDYAHDVKAMAEADPDAGLIYVCNPNNPTGTLTPRSDLEWLVANKPKGAVVLIDEAYIHFSEAPYCTDLVAADKDVIVLRTFSKLYGMAGLRAGAAIARPDLLAKIRPYGAGALPVTGMVGAHASLKVKNLVAERRKLNRQIRSEVFEFLEKHNFSYVPSESNCFMLDAKRPAAELIKLMAQEKVFIGRVWPAWPQHTRITVGTAEEMEKFKRALLKVYA
ncbi:MAG: pyridoxal phosphate-dependent aminotransferase [Bryobacteraceae bacterium]|nr:pyridoxal phosphate-dependent aminotransferase [Bryobacteraceae bacterium]MDW8378145.1 pyridoxal phosphate-dependent aminotransferase [Bryobacterales bacterium]